VTGKVTGEPGKACHERVAFLAALDGNFGEVSSAAAPCSDRRRSGTWLLEVGGAEIPGAQTPNLPGFVPVDSACRQPRFGKRIRGVKLPF